MPWELERAITAKQLSGYGWAVTPWEMEEMDIRDLKLPLALLGIHSTFQDYGGNLDNIKSEGQADMIMAIERMRAIIEGHEEE